MNSPTFVFNSLTLHTTFWRYSEVLMNKNLRRRSAFVKVHGSVIVSGFNSRSTESIECRRVLQVDANIITSLLNKNEITCDITSSDNVRSGVSSVIMSSCQLRYNARSCTNGVQMLLFEANGFQLLTFQQWLSVLCRHRIIDCTSIVCRVTVNHAICRPNSLTIDHILQGCCCVVCKVLAILRHNLLALLFGQSISHNQTT